MRVPTVVSAPSENQGYKRTAQLERFCSVIIGFMTTFSLNIVMVDPVMATRVVATTVSADGDGVKVWVSIPFNDHKPAHSEYMRSVSRNVTRQCVIESIRSECYLPDVSVFGSDPTYGYGVNMVAKSPVPLAVIQMSDAPTPELFSVPPKFRSSAIAAAPTLDKVMAGASDLILSSSVYFWNIDDASPWTYEPIGLLQNRPEFLLWLGKLTTTRPTHDCVGAYPCAGIFRFMSQNYNGYAYCAYEQALSVVSTPTSCTAVYFETKKAAYYAAFATPFLGYGGAGFEGFDCSISGASNSEALTNGQDVVSEAVSKGLIGITLRQQKTIDAGYQLVGKRAFLPSLALPGMYEYTTAVLSYNIRGTKSASLAGSITVTVNAQKADDRKSMLEPDDSQLAKYQGSVKEDLETRLRAGFGAKVECTYVNP